MLADNQSHLGYCIVILNRHCGDLAGLTDKELRDFLVVVRQLEVALRKAFGATMFNWSCLMNNAYQKDPAEPHVHWHCRPRYHKAVRFAGTVFVDPLFGHHYDPQQKRAVSSVVRRRIIEKIQKSL